MTTQDRGLQSERTRLAWGRTALACAAVGALLLHGAEGAVGLAAGAVTLLCAVAMVLCGARRYGGVQDLPWWVGVLAVTPGLVAAVALVLR
ncbi:uncharacterized membrane protein YidH (DUF202 family) [Actinokineospora baliensis]|uniref:DUF202 domain-containing protein n=1 Tax=Actinokineospora baliensis TaxID=547056 RepID=UPI00195AD445|nr:DUF202 domain-containing protein [Actinokineospora baliensis]MBM7772311.1 uncharacterized membrane protein YidH (DUF202 family) [Actinokineospora baliensis]